MSPMVRKVVECMVLLPMLLLDSSVHARIAVPPDGVDPIREAPRVVDAREAGVGMLVGLPAIRTLAGDPLEVRSDDTATLLVMTSTTCPLSRKWLPVLVRFEAAHRARGLRMVLVDVQGNDSEADFRRFCRDAGFEGDAVHDPGRMVAASLGATTTTEAFLLDGRRTLRYRGAVDDRIGLGYTRAAPTATPLADAVEAVLAGSHVDPAATTSPGCELGLADRRPTGESEPSWHGTIARLFDTHCVSCHRAGGVGPFPLDDEAEARANASMIARQVERGLMPPWFAAPPAHGGIG